MSSYSKSIHYLYALQLRGVKLGLRGIRALLNALGNPQNGFPSIHIAGTNGKGSTAAMLAAMLTAAGYKTGLYTSPHVLNFTERIRIDGTPISTREVVNQLRTIKPFVQQHHTTFFETVTAIAFQYFKQRDVDIAIIETGLGGRLDATNVVTPLVSIITNIGLEHTEILGKSISKIAVEKAGIIKPGVPCVIGNMRPEAVSVMKRIARQRSSKLIRATAKFKRTSTGIRGSRFDMRAGANVFSEMRLTLPGRHQLVNTAIALKAVQQIKRNGILVSDSAIRKGLAHIQQFSGLQSRLAVASSSPTIITDVAHNPDAFEALVRSLQELQVGKVVLVVGVSADKDYQRMVRLLKPIVDRAIVVAARTERARAPRDLREAFIQQRVPVEAESSVKEGVLRAKRLAGNQRPILITGSHFVVGEAVAVLQKKKYLTINQ